MSGSWLCCSQADTLLFTAVFAEGSIPDAATESTVRAEFWSHDNKRELIWDSLRITCKRLWCYSQFDSHQISVSLSEPSHRQSLEEAALNVSRLILLEQAVGLQLRYPDVEEFVAFCLEETGLFNMKSSYIFVWRTATAFDNYSYLHMIENVSCVQVDPIWFLVYRHYCQTNVEGALHSPPGDLEWTKCVFKHFQMYNVENPVIKCDVYLHRVDVWSNVRSLLPAQSIAEEEIKQRLYKIWLYS